MRFWKATTSAVLVIAAAAAVLHARGELAPLTDRLAPLADKAASLASELLSKPADAAAPPPAMPAMPVPVTAVISKTVPIYLDYTARTESIRSIVLQAKVSGYLLDQAAADGADVKQGDLLYRIDPRDYQAALDQVKAQLQRDIASLDYNKASLNRGNELSRTGFLSKDSFDQRSSAVQQGEATVVADKAAIKAAELNLAYTEIRAPFAGRLGRNQAPAGTLVTPGGTALNTLVQISPIYVTFTPSETDLTRIRQAQATGAVATEVTVPETKTPPRRGELTFVDNTVDHATGTIVARATIANADLSLLPGQYVNIRLLIGEQPDTLLVPQVAVGSSQFGKYVYVIDEGNKVGMRLVELGSAQGDLVAVAKGLKAGDQVITGNLQKIGPGMPVAPIPAKPAAAPTA